MCTVSFVPQNDGFVFTSNRDEDPARAATQLIEKKKGNTSVFYMEDPLAKGTWFAFSAQRFACVLNGAFEPHVRKEKYRMSRGAMALESFDYKTLNAFRTAFSFAGMEPFTLLLYNRGDFQEWVWDEEQLHVKNLSTSEAHLWSSSTLYTRERWQSRKNKLLAWDPSTKTQEEIMLFHKEKMPFTAANLQERLGGHAALKNIPLQTTSVTSLRGTEDDFKFHFQSNLKELRITKSLN